MKLLYCKKCDGVINLQSEMKSCPCGECSGKYNADNETATYTGDAIPFAIDNFSFFERALRPNDSLGNKLYDDWHGRQKIQCWIIKEGNPNANTIIKTDEVPKQAETTKLSRCK